MAEYIEREALITKFKKMELGEHGLVERLFADGVYAVIAAFPAADVAPVVHGRWIVRFDGPYKRRRCYCSHCGKHNGVGGIAQNQEKPYCPNCGAKMDGGADNDA
jgi:hypothetical protein